jgi:hypothetical protein
MKHIKRVFAMLTALFLSLPNAILTSVCFYALIGNLSYIFGVTYTHEITMWLAAFLGIGLTIAEAMTHMDSKDKGLSLSKITALILFTIINVFAGNYRIAEGQRNARMDARQTAQTDPRWQALDQQEKEISRMLHNKYAGDDAQAAAALDRIAKEREALVAEYVADSHVQSGFLEGIGSSWFFNLLWITINLAYGIAIRIAYAGNNERETTKPVNLPAMKFRKTLVADDPELPKPQPNGKVNSISTNTVPPQPVNTKPRTGIGFHANYVTPLRDEKEIPDVQLTKGKVEIMEDVKTTPPPRQDVKVDVKVDEKPQVKNVKPLKFTEREMAIIRACKANLYPPDHPTYAGKPHYAKVARQFPKLNDKPISRQYVEQVWKKWLAYEERNR